MQVPILAGLTGKQVRPLTWACALAALVGVGLLEGNGGGGIHVSQGDCWQLFSALAFGVQACCLAACTIVLQVKLIQGVIPRRCSEQRSTRTGSTLRCP